MKGFALKFRASRTLNLIIIFVAVFSAFFTTRVLSARYVVPIMMYHKVQDSPTIASDTVSPANFERHLAYLKRHGYRVIRLNALVEMSRRGVAGRELPRKAVVISFDDGYANNYTQAFPLLKKYEMPAIFFVSPDFMGKEGFMNWAQVAEMARFGMDIGSHGLTQTYLPDASFAEQEQEILESKRLLEQKLGVAVDFFAYPVGGFNDSIKRLVQQAGYAGALTTNRGNDRYNRDVYEMNRVRFSDKDDSRVILWMKLNGFYNFFRKMKKPS